MMSFMDGPFALFELYTGTWLEIIFLKNEDGVRVHYPHILWTDFGVTDFLGKANHQGRSSPH